MTYEDRGAGALPKLYGAPAYRRQVPVVVTETERPFDPDDLPLESLRMDGEPAAETSTASSAWMDMMVVMGSSAAGEMASPVTGMAGAAFAPEPEGLPADPLAPAEASRSRRLGGLFKGRSRGAS